MSDSPIAEQRQWDVERYLLDDPSLNRDEFEARMLDDEQLALAVADEVELLQRVVAACREPVSAVTHGPKSNHITWHRIATIGLAIAATLLVALLVRMNHETRQTAQETQRTPHSQPSDPLQVQMRAVAEQWVALDVSYDADETSSAASDLVAEPAFDVGLDEEDWMLQAAREFFLELES